MLSFGIIAFFWLLLTIIPVIVFYFLRMRFRQQPVSSTYIWDKFRYLLSTGKKLRWRTILLLILQIASLILLIITLAKPSILKDVLVKPGTCFLIDVSASMSATDEKDDVAGIITRLDKAKKLLIDEVNKLPSDANIMIFSCASYANELNEPTTNKNLLIDKIKSITTTDDEFLESEVAGKISAWLKTINQKYQIFIITDGGLDMKGQKLANQLKSTLKIMNVGKSKDNIGLNGLRLINNNEENSYQAQFFIRNNFETDKIVNIILKKDKNILIQKDVTAGPGLTRHQIDLTGEIETGSYSIEINNNIDYLLLDDICYLSVNEKPQIKVLVVGKDNPFINAALSYNNILFSTSDTFPLNETLNNWDIIISNYIEVPKGIKNNLLSFGEIPLDSSIKFGREVSGTLMKSDSNHPLLRYIEWEKIRVINSPSLIVNSGAYVLSMVNNLPVLVAWEEDSFKYLICSIDIFNSDIGLSGSFPMFLQNYIAWCVPQNDNQLKYTINAGERVVRYESPQWKVNEKNNMDIKHQGNRVYINALKTGIFNWENAGINGTLSVNIPLNETDITLKNISFNTLSIDIQSSLSRVKIPVEKMPLFLFLILIIAEWFLWIGLPFKKGVK